MIEITRRLFFKLLALGTTTMATESTAREKAGYLIPYVIAPEKTNPVRWSTVATTCRECPAGCGIHMRHRDGRITKAEGNPSHPVNRGGLCARGQSSVQGVYDPDRLKGVIAGDRKGGFKETSWNEALSSIPLKMRRGRPAIMSRLETGMLAEMISAFADAFGSKRYVFYEAFNYGPLKKANRELFGSPVVPHYRLDKCDYILSFAADFLETWISNVQFAHEFADMHGIGGGRIGHLVYVGPRLSMTAANADHFIQVPPGSETAFALAVLRELENEGLFRHGRDAIGPMVKNFDQAQLTVPEISPEVITKIAREFARAENSIALAGPVGARGQTAERLAAAAALLNYTAGRGDAIDFSRPHALSAAASEDEINFFLESISPDDTLIILNTNPVYERPGSEAYLSRAGLIVYCGTMFDETARIADWILPASSYLESWGDYEPYRGINGMIQPTMRPLYDSRETGDILIALAANSGSFLSYGNEKIKSSYEWLQARWSGMTDNWKETLRQGGDWPQNQQTGKRAQPRLRTAGLKYLAAPVQQIQQLPGNQARLCLWPSVMLHDGRVANRGWLQENPEPVSYIAWGNYMDIHPDKAGALGIKSEDVVELTTADNSSVQASARVTNEVGPDTVALAFGHGHTGLGMVADNLGANGFVLMPSTADAPGHFGTVSIKKTVKKAQLALALGTRDQHRRELLQWRKISEVKAMRPGTLKLPLSDAYIKERDLYPGHKHVGHRWAMVIDLQRCVGCQSCAVACYAENNLPITGKHRTRMGRNMPWLRVVPYRDDEVPLRIGWLPMLCQHCDSAPCEPVCPVFAAVNNEEGLNAQIYNRCIGTRYCSNNCPYKVRRFNWFDHAWRKPLDWQLNPEVTVRCRGVMEKCTFCVQRIRNVEYRAIIEKRDLKEGEITPACAQTCPAKVFTFGDLLDPDSEVTRMTLNEPRRYHVLEHLNTKPAVTYLFRIKQET